MKCRRARKLFFDFLDGVITDSDRVALEEHLMDCQACTSEASSLTTSVDLLHRLPVESPTENFNWKVRLRISREKNSLHRSLGSERAWLRSWNIRFAASAVSALVLALGAGYFVLRPTVMPSLLPQTPMAERTAVPAEGAADRPTAGDAAVAQSGPGKGQAGIVREVTAGKLVSKGRAKGEPIVESRDKAPYLVLDGDTLVYMHLESMRMKVTIRSLQQMVEQLQNDLRTCEKAQR